MGTWVLCLEETYPTSRRQRTVSGTPRTALLISQSRGFLTERQIEDHRRGLIIRRMPRPERVHVGARTIDLCTWGTGSVIVREV